MAIVDQETQSRIELLSLLDKVNNVTPQDLIQHEKLGEALNFSSGLPYFERALNLFHMLNDTILDRIPHNILKELIADTKEIIALIDSIKSFSPTDNNPLYIRDNYISSFCDNYNQWFAHIAPVVSFGIRKGTDFEALQRDAHNALAQLAATKKKTEDDGNALLSEAQSTLEKVRQAAAEVGVAQHAVHFQNEAKTYEKTTKNWLIALICVAVATSLWGFFAFYLMEMPTLEAQNQTILLIRAFSARIAVLMTLVFMLVWCSRNYAANRHNYIVNRHRQNALSTFETFVKAAGDDTQTKNAVLLQATQSIFASQPSGYVSKDTEDSPGKIIEIVKDVSKAIK